MAAKGERTMEDRNKEMEEKAFRETVRHLAESVAKLNEQMGEMQANQASLFKGLKSIQDGSLQSNKEHESETKEGKFFKKDVQFQDEIFESFKKNKSERSSKKKSSRYEPESESESNSSSSNHSSSDDDDDRGSRRSSKKYRSKKDSSLASIKLKIPEFLGKSDPEAYMEWEERVEKIFDIHDYSEKKKVKLAVVEFSGYASTWWRKLCKARRDSDARQVSSWKELKKIMRKKFIPSTYHRELFQKLQHLTQGGKSVEDYYKEMDLAMIRAEVDEIEEATMARFIGGLNRDIANLVELHHYTSMDELLQMAQKVENNSRGEQLPHLPFELLLV